MAGGNTRGTGEMKDSLPVFRKGTVMARFGATVLNCCAAPFESHHVQGADRHDHFGSAASAKVDNGY